MELGWRAFDRRQSGGLGITWVHFSELAGLDFSSETAVEMFYTFMLTKFAGLTLDAQYVRHPGGMAHRRNSLVGTCRLLIRF